MTPIRRTRVAIGGAVACAVALAAGVGAAAPAPVAAQPGGVHRVFLPFALRADPTKLSQPGPPSAPGRKRWTNITSARFSVTVAPEPGRAVVWAGTLSGAVRWDVKRGTYRVYTTADGLPGPSVRTVLPGADGSMWFATNAGLTHVSTQGDWTTSSADDIEPQASVDQLAMARDGSMWVTTRRSLLHGTSVDDVFVPTERIAVADILPGHWIEAIALDATDGVWLVLDDGVARRGPDGRWTTFTAADGFPIRVVRAVAAAPDGMWFGTDDGASHRAADGTWTTVLRGAGPVRDPGDGGPSDVVMAIAVAPDGTAWFAMLDALRRRAPDGSWSTFPWVGGDEEVLALALDDEGSCWAAMVPGLVRTTAGGVQTRFAPDGLLSERVNATEPDVSGGRWFATDEGASHRDRDGTMSHVLATLGRSVTSIGVEPDGTAWFGTFDGAIRRAPDGSTQVLTVADGLAGNDVSAILVDGAGKRWFGTRDGLSRRAPDGTWRTFARQDGLASDFVTVLRLDAQGDLWVGTKGGVTRFRPDGTHSAVGPRDPRFRDIRAIAFEPDGVAWIAAVDTVFVSSDHQIWDVLDGRRLTSPWVYGLEAVPGGAWVGTASGARLFGEGGVLVVTTADGLAANTVQCVSADPDGSVWFGTDAGASRLGP